MTFAVVFTVACIGALAIVLTLAVQRTVTNPVKRENFQRALDIIAGSELEDDSVDTALNKTAGKRRTWNQYWAHVVSQSGEVVTKPDAPGRRAGVVAVLGLLAGVVFLKSPLAVVAPVGALFAMKAYYGSIAAKRRTALENQLPLLLSAMRSSLQSGITPTVAITSVADDIPAPLGDEVRVLREDLNLGVELRAALRSLAARVPSREMQFLCASMEIAITSGSDLEPQLKIIEEVVRQRTRIRQKLKSAVSQVKPTAYLAYAAVPLMFLNSNRIPENRAYWFGGGLGLILLLVCGVLYGAGIVAIRFMIRSVENT